MVKIGLTYFLNQAWQDPASMELQREEMLYQYKNHMKIYIQFSTQCIPWEIIKNVGIIIKNNRYIYVDDTTIYFIYALLVFNLRIAQNSKNSDFQYRILNISYNVLM